MTLWTRPALPNFTTLRFSPLMAISLAAVSVCFALALAFALYAMLAPDYAPPVASNAEWKAPLPAVVELGEPKPASADVQTLTRPIFDKDRKPHTKAAGASAAQPAAIATDPTGLSVSAIVKHGGKSRAYIVSGGGAGDWKDVGDRVDAWTVSAISADQVTLSNGDVSAHLQLYNATPRAAEPPAAPLPARPVAEPTAPAPLPPPTNQKNNGVEAPDVVNPDVPLPAPP